MCLKKCYDFETYYNVLVLEKKANSIWCSQAVTHPSTDQTQRMLTLLIGREALNSYHKIYAPDPKCVYVEL